MLGLGCLCTALPYFALRSVQRAPTEPNDLGKRAMGLLGTCGNALGADEGATEENKGIGRARDVRWRCAGI